MDTNEHEGRWLVQLNGDSLELEKFEQFLSQFSKLYELLKKDTAYYFTAKQFLQLNDDLTAYEKATRVLEKARHIVPTLKGFAKLTPHYGCQSVEVGNAVMRGNHIYAFSYEDGTLNAHETIETKMIDVSTGQVSFRKEPKREKNLSHLDGLTDDPKISDALSYFAQDSSWLSLNKVYETILPDIAKTKHKAESKIVSKGWATAPDLDRFGYFANWYDSEVPPEDAKGIGGRHSREEYKKKHRNGRTYDKPIMHLPEAEALIRRILIGWLEDTRLS